MKHGREHRWCLSMAVCVVAMALAAGCGDSGDGSDNAGSGAADRGDFLLSFATPAQKEAASAGLLKDTGLIAACVKGLNDVFALPEDVKIVFRPSETNNAFEGPFYRPSTRTIEYPYGWFIVTVGLLAKMNPSMSNEDIVIMGLEVTVFTLFHEVAHSMIDICDIPVVGKEEDAADGLSAAILSLSPDTLEFLLAEASFFQGLAELQGGNDTVAQQFADEHSLSQQRYYQILCWLYGSDPVRFAAIAEQGYLPEDRSVRCQSEATQNLESWMRLLSSHVK